MNLCNIACLNNFRKIKKHASCVDCSPQPVCVGSVRYRFNSLTSVVSLNLHKGDWKLRKARCFAQDERTGEDEGSGCPVNTRVPWYSPRERRVRVDFVGCETVEACMHCLMAHCAFRPRPEANTVADQLKCEWRAGGDSETLEQPTALVFMYVMRRTWLRKLRFSPLPQVT